MKIKNVTSCFFLVFRGATGGDVNLVQIRIEDAIVNFIPLDFKRSKILRRKGIRSILIGLQHLRIAKLISQDHCLVEILRKS